MQSRRARVPHPLGLSLREQSRDEAIADAARRSALVTGALAVSTDPAVVERAVVASAEAHPPGRWCTGWGWTSPPVGPAAATWIGLAPTASRWSSTSTGCGPARPGRPR
ncbi:hypothetical protein NKG94_18965 [Micromonospora sp. M12]